MNTKVTCKKWILAAILLMVIVVVMAQPPGGGGGGGGVTDAPVDGGSIGFLAAATVYGYKRLRSSPHTSSLKNK